MTKKDVNEIKSQYTLEDCGILRLCGCYVDGERNKITQFNENFLNLPEEEKHKYFDIFKKTLSGTPGKNLVDMKFNVDAYADEGARTFLMNLRDSGLKDDRLLNEFYDRIINNYSYVGNYLILLINQVYDIPGITADNIDLEDEYYYKKNLPLELEDCIIEFKKNSIAREINAWNIGKTILDFESELEQYIFEKMKEYALATYNYGNLKNIVIENNIKSLC